ncbi:hypothetical protein Glove_306g87 [Diversispora epigaea]|uniref:Protein kinase domain-containing protein n=1 Tax=Diversispora epigaea TaxID=1348612 RepID=A0A397HZK3_9GLOM|nr:hypothetical protein Glove_306g87 [Diversispora epigaea]
MAPHKVLRWFSKSKKIGKTEKSAPRKPIEVQWEGKCISNEQKNMDLENSINYRTDFNTVVEWRKHKSLPPPRRRQTKISGVDPRRFGIVEPFFAELDYADLSKEDWNFFINFLSLLDKENLETDTFDEFETPATISVAKKETISNRRGSATSFYLDSKTERRKTAPMVLGTYKKKIESKIPKVPKVPEVMYYENDDVDNFMKITTTNKQLLSDICPTCERQVAEFGYCAQWCSPCQSKAFENQFETWTSGNDDIDIFILETQLASQSIFNYLEWIPYNRLEDVTYIDSGRFGSVYHAIWLDGPSEKWDQDKQQYIRCGQWKVALKSFNNSDMLKSEFFTELGNFLRSESNSGNYITRYYGITQDPKTQDYMLVIQYATHGNLRNYYQQNSKIMTWQKRLEILYGITIGLTGIHKYDITHKNLHSGNVLIHFSETLLGDLRNTHKVYDINSNSKIIEEDYYSKKDDDNVNNGETFEVLPYMAPEILCYEPYTKSSDVYSFGIIMRELAHLKTPFTNNVNLTIDEEEQNNEAIFEEENDIIPEIYIKLMKKCLSQDPYERPSSEELYRTIGEWLSKVIFVSNSEVSQRFKEAEGWRLKRVKWDEEGEIHPKKLTSKLVSWA